jgi:ketosteroid isomerase-like protein
MNELTETIEALERRFWDALVEQDAKKAADLLSEPALVVTARGAVRFDREQYRVLAENGPMLLKAYELTDVQVMLADGKVAVVTYKARQEVVRRGESHIETQQMYDSSTWLLDDHGAWKCVLHTEVPAQKES